MQATDARKHCLEGLESEMRQWPAVARCGSCRNFMSWPKSVVRTFSQRPCDEKMRLVQLGHAARRDEQMLIRLRSLI